MANLIFHYQSVIHSKKEIILHEAFSTRSGELYSINPLPVEVKGNNETEIEEALHAMEVDSSKYKAVRYSKLAREMERWVDEVEVVQDHPVPVYEDEEDLEDDFHDESGEVLDICQYIERNK